MWAQANEENEDDAGCRHSPAPEPFEAPGEEQCQGAVETHDQGGVVAREGVAGGVVARVEELRTGALKDPLEDLGEDHAPDRGHREQRGEDLRAFAVEGVGRPRPGGVVSPGSSRKRWRGASACRARPGSCRWFRARLPRRTSGSHHRRPPLPSGRKGRSLPRRTKAQD
jgi:hypothetical protein